MVLNLNKRYVEKISKVGVDPELIPDHKLDPECLPPTEASDLLLLSRVKTSDSNLYASNAQFLGQKMLFRANEITL